MIAIANSETLSYSQVNFDTTMDDPRMHVSIVLGETSIAQEGIWKRSQLQLPQVLLREVSCYFLRRRRVLLCASEKCLIHKGIILDPGAS